MELSPEEETPVVITKPRLEYEDPAHTATLLSQMTLLHKRGQFCDAKLIVGEHEANIHRAMLASASRFFFDMFMRGEEDGKNQTVFKLKDLSWDTFSPILNYIYSGRLSVAADQVAAVYSASQRLHIPAATQACAQHLITCLEPDNCLGIRAFAADEGFREQINTFIVDNIKAVTNSKKFYGLARISLEIVGTDEELITRTSHEELLPEVLDWLRNKMADHQNKLDRITEDLIVLYLNTDNTLTDCTDVEDTNLNENELVQDYKKLSRKKQSGQVSKSKDLLTPDTASNGLSNYMKFSIEPELPVPNLDSSIVASYRTKDRTYMVIAMLNNTLVSISVHYRSAVNNSSGTEDPDSPTSNGYAKLVNRFEDLIPLACMSTNRCAFGLKTLNNKLFACGGYDRGECLKSAEMYNFGTNTWTSVSDMKYVRGRFCIGLHDDNVYACGGSGGNCDIKTVECYDSIEDKWTVITQSPHAKASPGIAVFQDKLYSIGGCIGQQTVANCETFDLNTHTWSHVASLHLPRFQVAVTQYKQKIYAIGGTNGWKCVADVEVYDPTTNEWSCVSPMNIARRGSGVAVYKGKIHIIGGNDGTSALNSTEIYDPETNSWTVGPTLSTPRANCGVAVLDNKLFAVGGFSGKKFLNNMEFLDLDSCEYWCSHFPTNTKSVSVDDKIPQFDTKSQTANAGTSNGESDYIKINLGSSSNSVAIETAQVANGVAMEITMVAKGNSSVTNGTSSSDKLNGHCNGCDENIVKSDFVKGHSQGSKVIYDQSKTVNNNNALVNEDIKLNGERPS